MSGHFYEQVGVAMTCRDFEEYCRMFGLTDDELASGAILDVAAGGSSFVAEARGRGYEACAVDPRYSGDMSRWIAEAREEIAVSTAKLERLKERFDWSYYGTLDRHRASRERSLGLFERDVLRAREGLSRVDGTGSGGYYVEGSLPKLPFRSGRFNMVLCSHFLFLYADQFGPDFHRQAVAELMRVCAPGGQVRIYPLVSLHWKPYPQLEELLTCIRAAGGTPELRVSQLPFIPGSDRYLHISVG